MTITIIIIIFIVIIAEINICTTIVIVVIKKIIVSIINHIFTFIEIYLIIQKLLICKHFYDKYEEIISAYGIFCFLYYYKK